jgi:hypothetical protein
MLSSLVFAASSVPAFETGHDACMRVHDDIMDLVLETY